MLPLSSGSGVLSLIAGTFLSSVVNWQGRPAVLPIVHEQVDCICVCSSTFQVVGPEVHYSGSLEVAVGLGGWTAGLVTGVLACYCRRSEAPQSGKGVRGSPLRSQQ